MEIKPENNEKKAPDVRIDPSMDKYNGIVLFPEQLALANEQIKNSNFLEFLDKLSRKQGE